MNAHEGPATSVVAGTPAAAPQGKRYRAFISYSHGDNREQGRKWADWLHQGLETYHIPAELIGQPNARGEPIPAQIYPVFQDEKELSANADLSASLQRALDQSDFLVFLASPRSARSPYVQEELRHFKRSGKSANIIAMILRGEPVHGGADDPDQCFPEVLRHGVDAQGRTDLARTEEALAADVRLPHSREEGFTSLEAYRQHLLAQKLPAPEVRQRVQAYGERLELARLKIIATILGVPLADLTQRDQAYQLARLKRKNRLVATVAAGMGGLALAAVVAGVLAWQQKTQAQQNFALTLYTSGLNKLAQNEYGDPAAYIAAAVRGGNANATAFAESMLAAKEDLLELPNMQPGDLSFSPDGRYLAGRARVGANTLRLQVWDLRTRTPVADLPQPLMQRAGGRPRFDAAHRVYFTDDDARVLRYDLTRNQLQELLPNAERAVLTLRGVSPDGAWLGLARGGEELLLVDSAQPARRVALPTLPQQLASLAFAPDASAAALCVERDEGGQARTECRVVRLKDGAPDAPPPSQTILLEGRPGQVAFAPGGAALAFWRSAQIDLWDGAALRRLPTAGRIHQWVGFEPDGRTLLALTDAQADRYRVAGGAHLQSRPLPFGAVKALLPDEVARAALSPDGAHAVVTRNQRAFVQQLGPTPQLLGQIAFPQDTRRIVPDARGEHLFAIRRGGQTVSRTRVATQAVEPEFIRAAAPITQLHMLRTGLLGVVTADQRVRFHDTQTGQPVGAELPAPSALVFSEDHTRVTGRTGERSMGVWRIADGRQLVDWQHAGEGRLPPYLLDPGFRRLLQATREGWQVLDLATRQPLLRGGEALSLASFSPDGRRLALADAQGRVAVWEIGEGGGEDGGAGRKLFELQSIAAPLLRFSPDGQRLLVSEDARRLRLWRVDAGQPVGQVIPVVSATAWFAFSADGQRLFVQDTVNERIVPAVKVIDARNGNLISMPFAVGLFEDLALVAGEQRLLTVEPGADGTRAALWQVPGTLRLPPAQLAGDLESYYGRRYDVETGAIRPHRGTGDFASWFFADPYTRPVAPGAQATVLQEIERQLPLKDAERLQTLAATALYHPLARAGMAEFLARQGAPALAAQIVETTERQLANLGEPPAQDALRRQTRDWLARARAAATATATTTATATATAAPAR